MTSERMLELLLYTNLEILEKQNPKLEDWIVDNFDSEKINLRYIELLNEFLNDYALNKTEKSD